MSQLESMLAQLKQALAAKQQESGGAAVATLERDNDPEEAQKRQAAAAALQRWISECKPLERQEAVGSTAAHDPALNQALAQFVGFEVQAKPGQPYPLPIVPTQRAHGHGGHGGGGHGGHGGHGGGGHGGGGHGGSHGGNGGGSSTTSATAEASAAGNGSAAPLPQNVVCKKCAVSIAASDAVPMPAPGSAAPTPPPQPAAPALMAAPTTPGNFQWRRHLSIVENTIRSKDVSTAEALLKLLNDVAEAVPVELQVKVRLMTQFANIKIEKQAYDEAQKMLLQVLQLVEGTELKRSVATAYALDSLSQCYQISEKWDQAEKMRRAAVIIAEETLGGEHPDTAFFRERQDSLRKERAIASVGQDEGSKTVLDRLTAEYNAAVAAGQSLAAGAAPAADSVSGFMFDKYLQNGKTALNQKNFREAESTLRSAVEKGQALGDADPRKAEGLRTLAMALAMQDKNHEAKQLYEQALTVAFKFVSWSDINVGHCLAGLAALHDKQGEFGIAKNYYSQAIANYTITLGKEHETTLALQATYEDFLAKVKEELKWKAFAQ